MTLPASSEARRLFLRDSPTKETLLLQRAGSFAALLFSALGSFLYPALPEPVRAALPLPTVTLISGGLGVLLQRAVSKLWSVCLGDIAAEAAGALTAFVRLKKIQYYVRTGVLTSDDGSQLMKEIVEADIRRGLPRRRPPRRLTR
jgi:hypothetical protein